MTIAAEEGTLQMFDGRTRAQNGWFVVRQLLPAGRTENALVWHIHPHVIPGWVRPPVVSFNQVGYTPQRSKVAIIETDPLDQSAGRARVLRFGFHG